MVLSGVIIKVCPGHGIGAQTPGTLGRLQNTCCAPIPHLIRIGVRGALGSLGSITSTVSV